MMRDEVHPKWINKKVTLIITIVFLVAVILLVYLISFSFWNLNPLITIILIAVLLIVVVIGIFTFETTSMREIH